MIYSVKYAESSDCLKIQSFIEKHWRKDHILSLSKELLDFQHLNPLSRKYNFIIAVNNTTNEVDALLGFIPTYQYDKELFKEGDYWGAIWKVRTDVQNAEIKNLGLTIWEKLFELDNFQSWAAIGISEIAKKIYAISGMQIGELAHYYLPNINVKNFYIAEQRLVSIWTLRIIKMNKSRAIRIVDILGNIEYLPCLSAELQKMLVDIGAEYMDILNYGINEEVFFNLGFLKLNPIGDVIIPNYFEPFERKNIRIEFAYKADFNYVIFKGDSDQDRPNIIQ